MIIIAGDSWGCGEWKVNANEILHFGIAEYLKQDGLSVVNLSKGGESNLKTVDRLRDFCFLNPQVEKIIIFQTEWDRDLLEENDYNKQFCKLLRDQSADLTLEIRGQILTRFYSTLSLISLEQRIPIYLIGGLSDIDYFPDFVDTFPGVNPVCRSSINLVLTESDSATAYTTSCFSVSTKLIPILKQNCRSNSDLIILLEEITKANDRIKLLAENPKYFYPDGMHGNRLYHKILYNYLKTKKVF